MYRLEQVRQIYGARTVLDIPALRLERGEVFALVGPSGAGKSTLLRLLNFLEPPSTGRLFFAEQPVPAKPPLTLLRRVTTVFQRPVLLNRTVRENVAFGLQLRNEVVGDKVDAALKRVGLTANAAQPAHQLSGGEAQRAALARALALDTDVLLLDEPTANLDPYNVGLIETIVREHNQQHGTTVIVVTHNIFQAKRLAQRVGLMLNGQLIEVAPTAEFFEHPQDARTAAFVRGEMVW